MPNKYELLIEPNEGKKYTISIWDSLENYEDYDKLLEALSKITKKDSIKLFVSTPGGRCDIGFMLIDRILGLRGSKLDVIIPYPTYSMGALMALAGNSLTISPGAFIMFHDFSTGSRSKGNELFKSTEAYCEIFSHRFNSICQPFLSKKECQDVLQGKDLYIKWNDPTLTERIKRHF